MNCVPIYTDNPKSNPKQSKLLTVAKRLRSTRFQHKENLSQFLGSSISMCNFVNQPIKNQTAPKKTLKSIESHSSRSGPRRMLEF